MNNKVEILSFGRRWFTISNGEREERQIKQISSDKEDYLFLIRKNGLEESVWKLLSNMILREEFKEVSQNNIDFGLEHDGLKIFFLNEETKKMATFSVEITKSNTKDSSTDGCWYKNHRCIIKILKTDDSTPYDLQY